MTLRRNKNAEQTKARDGQRANSRSAFSEIENFDCRIRIDCFPGSAKYAGPTNMHRNHTINLNLFAVLFSDVSRFSLLAVVVRWCLAALNFLNRTFRPFAWRAHAALGVHWHRHRAIRLFSNFESGVRLANCIYYVAQRPSPCCVVAIGFSELSSDASVAGCICMLPPFSIHYLNFN